MTYRSADSTCYPLIERRTFAVVPYPHGTSDFIVGKPKNHILQEQNQQGLLPEGFAGIRLMTCRNLIPASMEFS